MAARYPMLFLVMLMACSAPSRAAANPSPPSRQWTTPVWWADNGQNDGVLWGAEVDGAFSDRAGWSASYLYGSFNQGGDIERHGEWTALARWRFAGWRFGAGWSYHQIDTDLERGFSWSYPEEEQERNADIHGPLLTAGAEIPLSASGLIARVELGALPHDFGELNDLDRNGRYAEALVELAWQAARWRAAAGYRYRLYDDVPPRVINDEVFDRDDMHGVIVSLAFLLP